MKNLVYLVNAGNDPGMSAIANDNSFPALGVLALGTWLKNNVPGMEVVVRDGGVVSNSEIAEEIRYLKPKIVGVSVLSTSYQNSLDIAKSAKDIGAYTVFGNDHAAQLSQKILEQRREVDFVIGSEYGEKPLELLVKNLMGENIPLEEIPNLCYRQGNNVRGFDYNRDKALLSITKAYKVKSRKDSLDLFPVVDRSLLPDSHWKKYLENYLSKFGKLHDNEVTGVTTMNRARGCSRANDKCKHCDMLLDISYSSPKMFWEEVKEAYRQVKANVFYEVCDSFTSFPGLIDGIIKEKPNDLGFDPKFFVYAQAIDLVRNPGLARKLKQMGVFKVNIGLESGSNKTLQHMKGKYDSVETNYMALQLLKEQGIHVYGSFVLGTDAETPETLEETVSWAKRIIKEGLIADIEAQPILPLPNNYYGKRLAVSGILDEKLDWHKDTDIVSKTYVDAFSGVSYEDTLEAANKIRSFAKKHNLNYGSGVSSEMKYSFE